MEPQTQPDVQMTPEHNIKVLAERPEHSSRWLALATLLLGPKMILLLPHFIILYVLGIFAFIVAIIAQAVVLFTGKYPEGMYNLVIGVLRWQTRTNAYFLGLTDKYPPFSLS